MQALLSYAKKLEPLPERYAAIDRTQLRDPGVPDARRHLSRNIATASFTSSPT